MNKVILHGNVGGDPEMKYTQDGMAIVNFSMATSFKTKGGGEKTEWHRIVAFSQQAEVIGSHVKKGMKILVEGRLQTRAWEDRDGNKRYTTEVVTERFEFSGGGKSDEKPSMDRTASQRHVDSYNDPGNLEDDAPF